ncbi:MAG: hypothetical protein WDA21_04775 [Bacilli bacterium]|jgi:hypothetical protein
MKAKILIITIVLLIVCVGTVVADIPSVFEINLLNYYTIQDLAETSFARYTPGVRMAFFITEWFGLAGDIIMPAPFDGSGLGYALILSTDLVFRFPLGSFDIYAGFGPAYDVVLADGTGALLKNHVNYSARLGFDFNITPVFALGIEANQVVNLDGLISGSTTYDAMRDTYVGLAIKVKL